MRIILITALFAFMLSGCAKSEKQPNLSMDGISFRDIPGITEDEIKAIEALQKQNKTFAYGTSLGIEAFLDLDGKMKGYSVLMAEWLSGLFGIPFNVEIFAWDDLLIGLNSGEIDFTNALTATDEHRKAYFMTEPIVQRVMKYIRLVDSEPLSEIRKTRLPRYALLNGTSTADDVMRYSIEPFEPVFISTAIEAYALLKAGEIDAFVGENNAEVQFDAFGDVAIEDFLPVILTPVSLSTQNPLLAPIISVVQKALGNGAYSYFLKLYNMGYQEYKKNKFFMQLTDEERAYLHSNPVVLYLAEGYSYPASFYNVHEKQWQGSFFDVLKELETFTGITFKHANDMNTPWEEMLRMLKAGEASMIADIIPSKEREGIFLMSKTIFHSDNYALLSKTETPNVNIAEVMNMKVALPTATAFTQMFRKWFPNHPNTVEYDLNEIFNALERGEVDMVMSSKRYLLTLTNYNEFTDYKINIVFDYGLDYTIGFNIKEGILCSIVDKALKLVDIEDIATYWNSKTFDYRKKIIEARWPWFIGAIILSLMVLTLVFVLFIRSRSTGKRLEKLVKQRTNELELRTKESKAASHSKSAFLANMSHEMRTPMNVVVGLTDLLLDEDDPSVHLIDNLKKINIAGNTLLGLINDVLDISKIEAGKLELTMAEYEVPSVLNDIITLNMIRIEEKPITFKLDISDDLPCRLHGDDLRVKQIINNILSNAFKYTQKGTVALGMSCKREGEYVWMSVYVSDTGIGIREADMKKLFTDYNQVDTRTNRAIEGTGLGLSISKRLTEMMDGEITAESEYGKGSTFRLRIRQGYVSDKSIGADTAENLRGFRYVENKQIVSKKFVRPDLSYARVLVVDDMQTNLDVAHGLLRKYKMVVDCVTNGQEAIARIENGDIEYNAIFMDHMMPGMDGVETTEKIRAICTKYAISVPIIALTANAIAGNEQMFLSKNFQAFLAKPINIMNLDAIVQRWVRDKSKE